MLSSLIRSMRLRTLPLSLSGVMCGGGFAYSCSDCSPWALLWLALTACALQVLSNLSNELGDYRSGVDNADRQGPAYGLAQGLSEMQLSRAVWATAVVCCLFGLAMIYTARAPWGLTLLGAAAIWAATHYTLGRNPYGYRGWGDLFVFLFFGLVSVMGSFLVVNGSLNLGLIWQGAGIGLLSVAVLNVNNIRDMATDRGHRVTTPIRIGLRKARLYHTMLVATGLLLMVLGMWLYFGGNRGVRAYIFLITLPLFVWHVAGVWRREGRALDPMLPLLVMSTFLMSILYTWGMVYGV